MTIINEQLMRTNLIRSVLPGLMIQNDPGQKLPKPHQYASKSFRRRLDFSNMVIYLLPHELGEQVSRQRILA
jgi:hypothetical protein